MQIWTEFLCSINICQTPGDGSTWRKNNRLKFRKSHKIIILRTNYETVICSVQTRVLDLNYKSLQNRQTEINSMRFGINDQLIMFTAIAFHLPFYSHIPPFNSVRFLTVFWVHLALSVSRIASFPCFGQIRWQHHLTL